MGSTELKALMQLGRKGRRLTSSETPTAVGSAEAEFAD